MKIEVANRLLGYVFALRSSGPLLRAWGGTTPFFFLFTAEAFEVLEKFLYNKIFRFLYLYELLDYKLIINSSLQKYDFKKSHVVETHSCYRLHLNSTFSEFKQIKLSFSVLGCTKQQQTD